MAKVVQKTDSAFGKGRKKTSIGKGNRKMSSMNKNVKRGYKPYRGQG